MEEKSELVLLIILLLCAAVCDVNTGRIPNGITFPGTILGLGFSLYQHVFLDRLLVVGMIVFLSYMAYVFVRHGIGMGDMKLWMMTGAFIGFRCSFLAFSVAQVLLLFVVILRGKGKSVLFGLICFLLSAETAEATEGFPFSLYFLIGTTGILLLKMGGIL